MKQAVPKSLVLVVVTLAALAGGVTLSASPRVTTDDDILAKLRSGRFADAERLSRQRLATVERESGTESVETADVLDLLSESMRQGGKGGQPEVGQLCERALRIKERALGKEDVGYAASLYQLGCWRYMNGAYTVALPLLDRSLRIRESRLGLDHPAVAANLFMIGSLQSEMGDHSTAKTLLEQSLAIRERTDPNGPGVAECLNALASVLVRMGDYANAEPQFRKAIAIWEHAWGPMHAKVGTGWNNLSTLLYATGDYEGALECKNKALSIRIRTLGPSHELVAWTRANMGMNLAVMGRKSEARTQYQQAISIQEKRFGRNSPEVGWTLKRLGDTYLTSGEFRKAIPILDRAMSNLVAGEPPDHPDIGEAMAALGSAWTAVGDTARGNELNRRAIAILVSRLGGSHPEVGFTLTQYAGALVAAGAFAPALNVALEGEEVSREHLRLTCRTMPERAALAYAASRPAGGRLALSILGNIPHPDRERLISVWDTLIRSRTLVLDEMALRMRMASEAKDPGTKRLVDRLGAARRRLANLVVAGPGDVTGDKYRAALDDARQDVENAERALAKQNAAYSLDRERGRFGFRDVSSALPQGSALVAYAATGDSYVAFVARAGSGEILFVPIGSTSIVDAAVSRWLTAVSAAGRRSRNHGGDVSRAAGDSLASLVWHPIGKQVEGVRKLFIVGDGALLLVNFDALPAEGSSYLAEVGPVMHYLNSERDLVAQPGPAASGTGLLALGDPSFDRRPMASVARSRGVTDEYTPSSHRDAWDCGDFQAVRFSKLPNSGIEAREIAQIWGDPAHTTVLTGTAADEHTFKVDAPGRQVLHLATHGFFLGGVCEDASSGTRGIGGTSPLGRRPPKTPAVSPIQLSGLALAGANERASAGPDEEDGILTAEEIASLDLSGTDWAVLSACDTGKGRIQVGEGVLGLRRAFQAAGAHTVIMSLWAVDDESTRGWMEALYRGRVAKKLDTADAVRQANLKVLRARRAQALSTDPFYWAAFVATGDWR